MIKYLENEEDFNEVIKTKCLVDFYADWCGPCKMLGDVLEDYSKTSDLTIVKVNTDTFTNIATKYGVMSIPTLIEFNNGDILNKSIGYLSVDELNKFIK